MEMLVANDFLMLIGMVTGVAALAVIIVELINFIPSLMVSVLDRMRNKTLAHEADLLTSSLDYRNTLNSADMDTSLDKTKSLTESDLFKRFKKQ